MTAPALGVCLAGPTASGKSSMALALAERLPVEIISVDSALVYRGMDIGTAKPMPAERQAVPHHLIDIIEPEQSYSAARFAQDAQRLAAEIRARGRVPLLVGGTMLYFKALRDGLDVLPQADAATRAAIEAEAAQRGWPALHAELARVDAATAARLAPADSQRISRALEVWRVSGRALSDWHGDPAGKSLEGRRRWPMLSLEPEQRSWLHERIARRCDQMLADGLVEEVRALLRRPGLHADLPAIRCVGYRQVALALPEGDTGKLRTALVASTRQLAKRQLTWLRSITDRAVATIDQDGAADRALDALQQLAAGVAR